MLVLPEQVCFLVYSSLTINLYKYLFKKGAKRVMYMEQKQLDNLDESYFGEEFIDEELLTKTSKVQDDEIKIEAVEAKPKVKKKVSLKKSGKTLAENTVSDKVSDKYTINNNKSSMILEKTMGTEPKADAPAVKPKVEPVNESLKAEFIAEAKAPVDPFKSESTAKSSEKNTFANNTFANISTWKTITGIAIILLIFSVFTQGFHFTGEEAAGAAVVGKEIPLEEAEWRVVQYVNKQLLEPPFLATSEGASKFGPLYKIALDVAGEKVVSYVTKDGRYFFPQGLDISFFVTVEEVPSSKDKNNAVAKLDTESKGIPDGIEDNGVDEASGEETAAAEANGAVNGAVILAAKKWIFSPNQITVKEGEMVTLKVEPENLDFTLAIPGLGVEKEISGPTTVEFKAAKKGSFAFTCSSCEEWRGMSGKLVVE